MFEFFWRCAEGAAVVGVGDLPQHCLRIMGVNEARMTYGDVAVDLAVDKEDRNIAMGDGLFGRDLLHIQSILPSCTQERDFDDWAE